MAKQKTSAGFRTVVQCILYSRNIKALQACREHFHDGNVKEAILSDQEVLNILARDNSRLPIVKFMIETFQIHLLDTERYIGEMALNASASGADQMLSYLIAVRDKVKNYKDTYGDTPLHKAALAKELECAKTLLQNGADANQFNDEGWAPLHIAAASGDIKLTGEILKNSGEDIKQHQVYYYSDHITWKVLAKEALELIKLSCPAGISFTTASKVIPNEAVYKDISALFELILCSPNELLLTQYD